MPIAYSYRRFSSEAQDGNDSIRRQTASAQKFIDDHPEYGLVLDTTLSMVDAGVSAFKGDNLKSGALGVFMDAVRVGSIAEGSWLLLESLDRFTRQSVNRAAADLLSLINRGIVVVTLHNGTIYREEDFEGTEGLVNLLGALIAMQGHHQEQVTKGKRVAAAWGAKYDQIGKGHVLTTLVPFWLQVNRDRSGFDHLPDRVEVVREIYGRRANGEGKGKIARELTARSVPTPKGRGEAWAESTVSKILETDAVIGVFANARGDRFEGYYPRVIDEATYQAVKALRAKPSTQGARPNSHPLTRLAQHDCGTTMRRINKGAKGGPIKFACPKCQNAIPYSQALSMVKQALFQSQWVPAPVEDGSAIQELENDLTGLDEAIEEARQHWRKVKTLSARELYESAIADRRLLVERLNDLKSRNTAVLVSMEEKALDRANQRGDLLIAIPAAIVNITFDTECKSLTIKTLSGKEVQTENFETTEKPF
jgi:hypothetical protein